MKKILSVFLFLIFVFVLFSGCTEFCPDSDFAEKTRYSTQEECEKETGCTCGFADCDYIPADNPCACKGFPGKGWYCIKEKANEEIKKCTSDSDCIEEEKCYNPSECGLGWDNKTVDCPLRDDKCHKECETDLDCSATEKCLDTQWSDNAFYKLCFEDRQQD